MIKPPGCCHDCVQHGNRAPRTLGTEYAGYRACRYHRQRGFSGTATAHGGERLSVLDLNRLYKPRASS